MIQCCYHRHRDMTPFRQGCASRCKDTQRTRSIKKGKMMTYLLYVDGIDGDSTHDDLSWREMQQVKKLKKELLQNVIEHAAISIQTHARRMSALRS